MARYTLEDLLYLMQRLRDPRDGCPWDLQQTFATIVPYTLEEAYEVADTIEREDWPHLKDELGDLLFQVVFYAQMGQEEGRFDFDAIVSNLVTKMLRRHPHVFPAGTLQSRRGDATDQAPSEQSVKANWERIKADERAGKQQNDSEPDSVLDDVPKALPALNRAVKLQKRAARTGFDWPEIDGVVDKLREEVEELAQELEHNDREAMAAELGDVLFSIVNMARQLGVNPDTSLRATNQKFEQRFRYIEQQLAAQGKTADEASLDEMDALWEMAKKLESRN